MTSVRLTITGRVQGVFFRHSAKKLADSLGLVGFAANQADGSVLIEISGNQASLEQFVKWCHQGPELARVDGVKVEEETGQDKAVGFTII